MATEASAIPQESSVRGPRSRSRRYISAHAYYHAIRADLARSAGDLETARHSLRLALVYDPASFDLHLELARILIDIGEGEPERLVQRAIQLDPSRAEGWSTKGDLLVRRGQRRAAERAYRRAFRLQPGSTEGQHAASALASLYQRDGRPELARRVLKKLSAVDALEGALLLATHDLEEGRIKEAESALLALAAVAPPELKRRVAERLAWLLRFDLAQPLYASSLQAEDQRLRVTEKELQATLHLSLLAGDQSAALRALERIALRSGVTEQRRAAESVLLSGRGPLLRELAVRRTSDVEVDLGLLALEVAAGAPDRALRLRASDPSSPVPRIHLVEALLRRGNKEAALTELEPLTQLEPSGLAAHLGPRAFERLTVLMLQLRPDSAPPFLAALSSRTRALILSARVALGRGATAEAGDLLSDVGVEADAEGLALLSRLELSMDRRRRVELQVEHALEREPENAQLWRARARLHLAREELPRARVALGRSLFHEPDLEHEDALLRALSVGPRSSDTTASDRRGARP